MVESVYCVAEKENAKSGPCKIGVSGDPIKRLAQLQGGNPRQLCLMWSISLKLGGLAYDAEQTALRRFRPNVYDFIEKDRLKSEWIAASPKDVLAFVSKMLDPSEIIAVQS